MSKEKLEKIMAEKERLARQITITILNLTELVKCCMKWFSVGVLYLILGGLIACL